MMKIKITAFDLILLAFVALLIACNPAHAADQKYCGQPKRNAAGEIVRSKAVKAAFRAEVACPSTGLFTGFCPGWSIDHVWSLASCGCDSVTNMQWLPNTIKSCAGTQCKDRWELEVYKCRPEDMPVK